MKTITIAGAKGGTGKTTTVLALAYELARAGHHVTIADCDPQAMATQGLRQSPADAPLASEPVQLELAFPPSASAAPDAHIGSVFLARGGRPLAAASRADIADHLARLATSADILLVDTMPTVTPMTMAALAAADVIIVTAQAAPYSVSGLMDVLQVSGQANPSATTRALLTQVSSRRWLTSHVADAIESRWPGLLYEARIPDDARCERASLMCLPVGRFDARSRSAVAYRALAIESLRDLHPRRSTTDAGGGLQAETAFGDARSVPCTAEVLHVA